jgi:hypothetical protein
VNEKKAVDPRIVIAIVVAAVVLVGCFVWAALRDKPSEGVEATPGSPAPIPGTADGATPETGGPAPGLAR